LIGFKSGGTQEDFAKRKVSDAKVDVLDEGVHVKGAMTRKAIGHLETLNSVQKAIT
jgi:hypothetical protein